MTVETDPNQGTKPGGGRRWKRPLLVAAIVAVGLSAAVATTTAFSDNWRGGWHHGPMWGAMSGANAEVMAERLVKHLAIEIDATGEQQEKLVAIARGAAGAVAPLHESLQQTHEQARQLLTAPSVDRAAIEALRAKQIAAVDEASKRLVGALTDAAEVLTPEQRAKIAEHMASFGGRHGGGWPGRWDRQ